MKVEGPEREKWPRSHILSFMASLSCAARLSASLYIDELAALLVRPERKRGES